MNLPQNKTCNNIFCHWLISCFGPIKTTPALHILIHVFDTHVHAFLLAMVAGRIMVYTDVYILIPRTYEYVVFMAKGN